MTSNRMGDRRSAVLASFALLGAVAFATPAHSQVAVDIIPGGWADNVLSAIGRLETAARVAMVNTFQQVSDASNTTVFDAHLSIEEQRIVRAHQVGPAVCAAVDGAQVLAVTARQTTATSVQLQRMMDQRVEGQPNSNGYQGSAQSAQSATNDHGNFYCSALEASDGECTVADPIWQDRDEQAASIFGPPTYSAGDSDAAYATAINSTQPYVPRVRRGGEANSTSGQSASPERRQYNTNISLAQAIGARIVASRNQTTTSLGPDLQRQQVLDGRPATAKASWWDATNLEIERRTTLQYHKLVAGMDPSEATKELLQVMILQNQILWATYNQGDQRAMVEAASLAYQAKEHLDRSEGVVGSTAPFPQAAASQ